MYLSLSANEQPRTNTNLELKNVFVVKYSKQRQMP